MASDQQATQITDGGTVSTDTVSTDTVPSGADELSKISKLLTLFSKYDALVIFSMAKEGIEADISTCSKLGLTRKQYYTRLRQLRKAGLIQKRENHYYQTTMGSFILENCINSVMHAITNSRQMAMIDALKREREFSDDDMLKVKSLICGAKQHA